MAASAIRLRATGVDFILLNVVIGWSLSTNVRPADFFSCLVLGHAARESIFYVIVCW